ncbi:MAG: glycosyltransferase family 4 protein [Verrucomicrobia bacterium]|nr:glycosyltransferase family 4 protein [Verrucomicrobiota bacterium]
MISQIFTTPVATVAMNLQPRGGSWGGANQWTTQLSRWLRYHGWNVRYDLKKTPDVVLMTHTGLSAGTTFGAKEVADLKKRYPHVPCVHRINDNDLRKNSSEMDQFLAESNRVADHTVFVSKWLRDHHGAKWFDLAKSHSVITPGADPRFFHPIGTFLPAPGEAVRLVTHHWSDNWNKGFDVYQQIDEWISKTDSNKFELWIIGRWPKEIQWKIARTFAAASGAKLAELLQQCHGYVSASRYEPGAMHVAEGLQCGLPLLYHRDTGGTVEQGLRYGMEIGNDLGETLGCFLEQLPQLRAKLLVDPPSGSKMSLEYLQLLQRMIVS